MTGMVGVVDVVLHLVRRACATMRLQPLRMAYGLSAAAVVWFVVRLIAPIGPVVIGWLPGLLSIGLVVCACVTTARRPGTPRSVTQFWLAIAAAAVCVGAGTMLRVLHGLAGATARTIAVPEMVVYLLAMMVIGWALLRLPLGLDDARQRWRFWLDMSTVMVATALFFWYFSVRPGLGVGNDDQAVLTGLIVSALALVQVFAVAKVVLTGAATIDSGSLRALGFSLLLGTIGSAPEPLLPVDGPSTGQIVVPITSLLAVVAAARQHRGKPSAPAAHSRPSRRFSVLPYSAVAASSVLLLYTAVHGGAVDRATVAGIVVCLVGLVISRQVLAFADNARLVTQLDAGLAALAAREQRFRALVRNSSDFITITGRDGILTYVSPGVANMLGHEPAAWTGRLAADLIHPDDLSIATERFLGIKDVPGATAVYEARLLHADGSWRLVEASITNLMDDPAVNGIVGNARDITGENAFRQRLQHQADHDALTGLANRSLLQRRMREALAGAAGNHVSVLLVDLNDFKILNDTLGHIAGDEMIVGVAQRLLGAAPVDATVARLGGDEFAVLVINRTPVPDGVHRAGRDGFTVATEILDAFVEPVDVCGYRTPIAASIGVAVAEPGLSADELLRRADVAMYAAKAARDGASSRWAGYSEELDRPLLDRAELEAQLRVAIDEGHLRLQYQPIVSARTGAVINVEALVRWDHPQRGLLPPAQFVALAERSSLILELGRWTLDEACRQAGRWYRDHGAATPGMSVNVSARQLHDPTFTDHVAATLLAAGLPPHLLTIEITETTAVHANAVDVMRALHDLGVRVSLDDFGTGHSSLSLLQSCPADEVKLDRSFTRTAVSAGRRSVAVAVIELATALGLDVVAEGVETAAEADCLVALGYDRLQGFHFARPGGPADIDGWVERTRAVTAAA